MPRILFYQIVQRARILLQLPTVNSHNQLVTLLLSSLSGRVKVFAIKTARKFRFAKEQRENVLRVASWKRSRIDFPPVYTFKIFDTWFALPSCRERGALESLRQKGRSIGEKGGDIEPRRKFATLTRRRCGKTHKKGTPKNRRR